MVLRCNVAAHGAFVDAWLVVTTVSVGQLVRFGPNGKGEQLIACARDQDAAMPSWLTRIIPRQIPKTGLWFGFSRNLRRLSMVALHICSFCQLFR